MVKAIVGANWGDEGKGKITDLLASDSDIVIRFQGGANAGHTIINEHGRFALHLMPSGVCHENIVNIIGNGVALDINKFIAEYNDICSQGLKPTLMVSDRVQVIMPYHVDFDKYEEAKNEILFQLDEIRKGNVTADELEYARASCISDIRTVLDSPSDVTSFYFSNLKEFFREF